jgi:hypothetical protein
MAFEPGWWEQDLDRAAYRANRAELLNKLLLDHVLWVRSLDRFGTDASLAATWVDRDGQDQVTALDQAFLAAHLRILRSVMHDLARCGPEGQHLIQTIVAEHLRLLHNQEEGLA